MICSECLKKISAGESGRGASVRRVIPLGLAAGGLLLAWLAFYALGRTLLLIPASVHDGVAWSEK